jgi:hypothetical protein
MHECDFVERPELFGHLSSRIDDQLASGTER